MLISPKGSRFLLLIFIVILFLFMYLSQRFLAPIVLGSVGSALFYPVYKFLKKKWSGNMAAIVTCILLVCFIFIPLIFVISKLYGEIYYVYGEVVSAVKERGIRDILFGDNKFAKIMMDITDFLGFNYSYENMVGILEENIGRASTMAIKYINNIAGNLIHLAFNFFMMLLVVYASLTKGRDLMVFLFRIIPLPSNLSKLFTKRWLAMNKAIIVGNGVSGLAQGALGGFAFYLAGIQAVFVWSSVMFILAFLPIVGITLVYVPTSIYLVVTGRTMAGLALFIFCFLVSFTMDNLIKPRLIGSKIAADTVFILYCTLSGLAVFGIIGIFYGPLIGSFLVTIFQVYGILNKSGKIDSHSQLER